MIQRIFKVGLCAGLGMLMVAACCLADDSMKLEYKFREGELQRYKMVVDMDLAMNIGQAAGEGSPVMTVRMVGVIRQRTKRVLPNGDAEIVTAVESVKTSMGGASQDMPVKSMPVITTVISKAGAVKEVKGLEKAVNLFGGMPLGGLTSLSQYSAFPAAELKVGDTWTQDGPFPFGGTLRSKEEVLSIGEKLGKYTVAKIKSNASGDLNFAMPLPASAQSGSAAPMDMKGTFTANALTYFSPDEGRLVRTDGTADITMAMQISGLPTDADAPREMDMNVRMEFEMFLLPEE